MFRVYSTEYASLAFQYPSRIKFLLIIDIVKVFCTASSKSCKPLHISLVRASELWIETHFVKRKYRVSWLHQMEIWVALFFTNYNTHVSQQDCLGLMFNTALTITCLHIYYDLLTQHGAKSWAWQSGARHIPLMMMMGCCTQL